MTFGQFLVLYLMAGAGVGIAVYASTSASTPRALTAVLALVFWPLFLPVLLCGASSAKEIIPAEADAAPAQDELAQLIAQVDAELQGAWHSLDGWAEDVLAREKDRLGELRHVWTAQAERIREMDRLLSAGPWTPQPTLDGLTERLQISQDVIEQNRTRLRAIRERTYQDLVSSLAWVRELVSMIHVAKFTGAPAARAEELVAEVAAAVEGLSALSWQDEASLAENSLTAKGA